MLDDDIRINSISSYVYQTILAIYQHHPQWLNDKFRNCSWQSRDFKAKFTAKLVAKLSQTQNKDVLVMKLLKILETFLAPGFFVSSQFIELITNIRKYTHPFLESENLNSGFAGSKNAVIGNQAKAPAIAILLLDAENLHLDIETEKFLASICTYSIQIKVAFANWRSMGKKDVEFHRRGYELIHVPPGKDSADVKMATVGSSIFVHYPTAKEVLVCSSDGVMTHLCTTLQTHGLTVYLVRKQKDKISILNTNTGQSQIHSLIPCLEITSLEQFITRLQEILTKEQQRTGNHWVKLVRISQLFQEQYQITISQLVSKHLSSKRARDIFIYNQDKFVIHQLGEESDIYVTAFSLGQEAINDNLNNSAQLAEVKAKTNPKAKIKSKVDLEQALVRIVNTLTAKSKESYVPISNVAAEFQRQYAKSITKAMKGLQLGSKFPNLLESYSDLKLEQIEKVYYVGLAEP
ncbi:MAG: NYN domain-containing protein [Xenococcaceae cyanobacterium]